jgi:hypothetical protein
LRGSRTQYSTKKRNAASYFKLKFLPTLGSLRDVVWDTIVLTINAWRSLCSRSNACCLVWCPRNTEDIRPKAYRARTLNLKWRLGNNWLRKGRTALMTLTIVQCNNWWLSKFVNNLTWNVNVNVNDRKCDTCIERRVRFFTQTVRFLCSNMPAFTKIITKMEWGWSFTLETK